MKNYSHSLCVALCLAAFLLICGTSPAFSQSSKGSKPGSKDILSKIVQAKRQSGPFVLLTPNDLASIPKSVIDSLINGGDPCETAVPIAFGETVNGSLASSDCRLDDFSYADFYTFAGTQGQQLLISLNSDAFDTYAGLANETGTFVVANDNGAGTGTNSRLYAQLPATGLYVILANSNFPNSFGAYSISLVEIIPCTYSINPISADLTGNAGTYSFVMTTQAGCPWSVYSSDTSWLTHSGTSSYGTVTINYTVTPNATGYPREGGISIGGHIFRVRQAPIACAYSINPNNADVPAGGGTFQFRLSTQDGCGHTAYAQNDWLLISQATGYGTTDITYTVRPNNGADRTGTMTVQGNTLTVTQPGRNCSYNVSPTNIDVSPSGRTASIVVDTQPACTWTFSSGSSWIELPSGSAGTGSGSVTYRVSRNGTPNARQGAILFSGASSSYVIFTQFGKRTLLDYDGDRRSDLSVRRPSDNIWYILRGTAGYFNIEFGVTGDLIAPADYDGDGKTDITVFRPSTGTWFMFNSGNQTFTSVGWGAGGDLPVPADYDADARADLVVFRPSTNTWYTRFANGTFSTTAFGVAGDKPVVGDFDGDGKADIALFRPSDNNWYILKTGFGFFVQTWGQVGDIPVPADYDGDGKTDVAVFRPSTGQWFRIQSTAGFDTVGWGTAGDQPIPADYDGDGKSDVAVFRPSNSTWYIVGSTAGQLIHNYGAAGDLPTQGAFIY